LVKNPKEDNVGGGGKKRQLPPRISEGETLLETKKKRWLRGRQGKSGDLREMQTDSQNAFSNFERLEKLLCKAIPPRGGRGGQGGNNGRKERGRGRSVTQPEAGSLDQIAKPGDNPSPDGSPSK